jgi:uncharacterized membrane protein
MTMAPVEYLIIGFPGNNFKGEAAPALADLIDKKLIRVLDLVFIGKDEDGNIVSFELDQLDEVPEFANIDTTSQGMLNDEDIEHAAEALEPGSSAAMLLWEDLWAADFATALRNSDAVILEGGRVPHELVQLAVDELAGG